jgi:hypothetical protein
MSQANLNFLKLSVNDSLSNPFVSGLHSILRPQLFGDNAEGTSADVFIQTLLNLSTFSFRDPF